MSKKTLLRHNTQDANSLALNDYGIKAGDCFRHFKGGLYIVVGFSWNATVDKWAVTYAGEDLESEFFSRDLDEFTGKTGFGAPRFSRISQLEWEDACGTELLDLVKELNQKPAKGNT